MRSPQLRKKEYSPHSSLLSGPKLRPHVGQFCGQTAEYFGPNDGQVAKQDAHKYAERVKSEVGEEFHLCVKVSFVTLQIFEREYLIHGHRERGRRQLGARRRDRVGSVRYGTREGPFLSAERPPRAVHRGPCANHRLRRPMTERSV